MRKILDILGYLALKTKSYSTISGCFLILYEPDLPEENTDEDVYY